MKIVVCIKQVPNTTEIKLDPVKGTLIRDGVVSIMNPDDKGALEQALLFKDKYNAHVTVVTMGPPQAEAILREAYAMGADRAILVSDKKFGGADTLATSYTLSRALAKIECDVIFAGRQAIDGDTAQVGPQIAEQLDLPQITYVECMDYNRTGEVEKISVPFDTSKFRVRLLKREKEEKNMIDITEAHFIVCGGRGVGTHDGFSKLSELALFRERYSLL